MNIGSFASSSRPALRFGAWETSVAKQLQPVTPGVDYTKMTPEAAVKILRNLETAKTENERAWTDFGQRQDSGGPGQFNPQPYEAQLVGVANDAPWATFVALRDEIGKSDIYKPSSSGRVSIAFVLRNQKGN